MSDRFESQNVDLTVGIATAAAQGLATAANGKHPVILAGITDPVGGKLVKSNKRPGGNITGTSGDSPIKQHLNLIKPSCQSLSKSELFTLLPTTVAPSTPNEWPPCARRKA